MGLITYIRHTLPEPVEKASKKLKMKDELVKRLYAAIPQCYKNKYHYKEGIKRVEAIYESIVHRSIPIYHLIDMSEVTSTDFRKWEELDREIINQISYAR